jgi:hypothetical protein
MVTFPSKLQFRNWLRTAKQKQRDLIWWRNEILDHVLRLLFFRNNGIYVLSESWDNLVILDACRFDVFEQSVKRRKRKGELESRISRGSNTEQFLSENFASRSARHVVYISANPYTDRIIKKYLYALISVWKDSWNDEYQTVLPECVYERSARELSKYHSKRFVIHFVQPHYPYIGFKDLNVSKLVVTDKKYYDNDSSFITVYRQRIYGEESRNLGLHFQAYKHNLELALDYVEKLLGILPGRTVVSADHGEAFGEKMRSWLPFRLYGHFRDVRIPALVKVPWFIVESKGRERMPTSEMSGSDQEVFHNDEEDLIKARLKSLGYE